MNDGIPSSSSLRHIQDHVRQMRAYVPGEQVNNACKLNTNECPWPASPKVFDALQNIKPDALRQYPSPSSDALRQAAAAHYNCHPEQILVGNGSDDCLTIIYRSICQPHSQVICPWPSYGLYDTLAQIENVTIRHCAYDICCTSKTCTWTLNNDIASDTANLCLIANPNNPSGTLIKRQQLETMVSGFNGIMVVDEAYIDFAEGDDVSMIDAINTYDNLIVLRTFSKSYSLAGARVGLLFANPALITEFNKVKDSYNVNAMSQLAAHAALCDTDYHDEIVGRTLASRKQLESRLKNYGWVWPESQANFLLCYIGGEAEQIYLALKERGILVRWWNTAELKDYLRITAGTPEENEALFKALDELLG